MPIKSISLFILLFAIASCTTSKTIHLNKDDLGKKTIISCPPNIELKKIDDEDVAGYFSFISSKTLIIHLPEGLHTFEVRIQEYRESEQNKELEKFISPSVILKADLHSSKKYQITRKKLNTTSELNAFINNPEFSIVEENTNQNLSTVSTKHIVSNPKNQESQEKPKAENQTNNDLNKESMFNFTWAKANNEEKEAFLKWAKSESKELSKDNGALKILQDLWNNATQEEKVKYLLLTK